MSSIARNAMFRKFSYGYVLYICALLPGIVFAGTRNDYSRQWPLTLSNADAGAYRVVLDEEMYRSVSSASMRDIEVFNAGGKPVPGALFAPNEFRTQQVRRIELPWFPLPARTVTQASDIAIISERGTDGRVHRIETRMVDSTPNSHETNTWLIDASAVHERIIALQLDWTANDGVNVAYRAEGSEDLRNWRTLQTNVQLIDLVRDGHRLLQRRIVLNEQAKYLRLLPVDIEESLPLTGVHAEISTLPASDDLAWENLPARVAEEGKVTYYEFSLPGRFPVALVDVAVPDNNAAEWVLQSRDKSDAPWVFRTGPWVGFRASRENRSAAQSLDRVTRDRYWRLSTSSPIQVMPTLKLGYRPESFVFLAQGSPPYALAIGSARAHRASAPMPQLIDDIRAQRDANWQPASAIARPSQPLSGKQAFIPAPAERNWKSWLLWATLAIGALVVAWLAISLLRKSTTP